jgi:hypothetical protein
MIFTTSWDDGRKDDLRLAELLEKYGATGTFYISPADSLKRESLTNDEVKELSQRHEIGAHTMTHPKLTTLPLDEARREIEDSKKWIESMTAKECTAFCYPYGDENAETRRLVQEAGFSTARGVEQLAFASEDVFCVPTTLVVCPFPFRKEFTKWWHPLDPVGRLRAFGPKMCTYRLPLKASTSWLNLAKALFTKAQSLEKESQLAFHLWGHSWEVEKYGMWEDVEKFLQYVSEQDDVVYSTNSNLLTLI